MNSRFEKLVRVRACLRDQTKKPSKQQLLTQSLNRPCHKHIITMFQYRLIHANPNAPQDTANASLAQYNRCFK